MAVNDKQFHAAATNGDVALAAINMTIALYAVANAVEALARSDKPAITKEVAAIRKSAMDLNKQFESLTGWTNE
jgi:hypothetical protein